jgi:hypothetical protein
MEQTADVRGKGSYPLSGTMTPLNYSMEVMFECGSKDANVSAKSASRPLIDFGD